MNLHKFPKIKVRTYFQVTGNLWVKFFLTFLIATYDLNRNYAFFDNDLELPQKTLEQDYDTPSGHKQFLCGVRTSNVSPYDIDWTKIIHFHFHDIELAQMTFVQDHDTP